MPGAELGVRIKWPNDLYLGAAKVGGVLSNSVYRDRQFQVPPCTQASTMCSKTSTSHCALRRPFNCASCGTYEYQLIASLHYLESCCTPVCSLKTLMFGHVESAFYSLCCR